MFTITLEARVPSPLTYREKQAGDGQWYGHRRNEHEAVNHRGQRRLAVRQIEPAKDYERQANQTG